MPPSLYSNGFVYAKGANIILFFLADPRLCMVYLILAMLQVLNEDSLRSNALTYTLKGMLLPEPTYKGPENITYFRANSLAEELARDTKVGTGQ